MTGSGEETELVIRESQTKKPQAIGSQSNRGVGLDTTMKQPTWHQRTSQANTGWKNEACKEDAAMLHNKEETKRDLRGWTSLAKDWMWDCSNASVKK